MSRARLLLLCSSLAVVVFLLGSGAALKAGAGAGICRYNLPVCVVVFNNNGVYRGTDVNPTGGADVAPTVFVKNARYDKLMEAFGGVGVHATTPCRVAQSRGRSRALAQTNIGECRDR